MNKSVSTFLKRLPVAWLDNPVREPLCLGQVADGISIKKIENASIALADTIVWTTRGLDITIPENFVVEQPIIISDLADYNQLTVIEKITIKIGKGSRVIFKDLAGKSAVYIKNIVYEIAEYATLEVHYEHEAPSNTFAYVHMQVTMKERAQFVCKGIIAGAGTVEFLLDIGLEHSYAQADASLVSIGREDAFHSLETKQYHGGEHTHSAVTVKQLVSDRAQAHYSSSIDILPTAKKVIAHQNHKALLLSKTSQAHANPQLNVKHNKDVQCSHGSAISQLDELLLWYLMTRGVSWQKAQALLIEGFLGHLLRSSSLEKIAI